MARSMKNKSIFVSGFKNNSCHGNINTQYICASCSETIDPKFSYLNLCADAFVCSRLCLTKRIDFIRSFDPKLETPDLWPSKNETNAVSGSIIKQLNKRNSYTNLLEVNSSSIDNPISELFIETSEINSKSDTSGYIGYSIMISAFLTIMLIISKNVK